jgi:hypothetical protein
MAYNKIITSEGNVQFQTVDEKIINVHPFHVYSLFNEDTVSFLLIAMPKSSGLAVFTSKAEDLEVNGVVYTFEELPDALAEAFAIAGAQARAEIVDELPETGMTNTIYLVPKPDGQSGFDEYIYLKDEQRWELIGDTSIEFDQYVQKTDFSAYTASTETKINYLSGAVDTEEARAISAETALQTAIDNEVSARTDADTALQNAINAEASARTEDVTALSGAIDTEIAAREAADSVISGAVDNVSADLANEVSRAISAETELQTAIDNEASARTSADTALQTALDNEISARTSADTDLQTAIDNEVSARTDADAALQVEIDELDGDIEILQTALADEVSARTDADTALDGKIAYISGAVDTVSSALTEDERVWGEALNDLNSRINTISGNALTSGDVQTQIDESISGKTIDYLSAGTAIDLTNNVISFTLPISAGTGNRSIIQGQGTNATAPNAHAEGYFTKANGSASHAEGTTTSAMTSASHAEGATTIASGESSHAEGMQTQAIGNYSHAEGNNTIAKNIAEHASGRYNVSYSGSNLVGDSGNTVFTVGNGVIDETLGINSRHNAFEVRGNGDIYVSDTNATGEYYEKPMIKLQDALSSGITSGDVQTMIDESISGKVDSSSVVTAVTSGSTDSEIPTAKAVYDAIPTGSSITISTAVTSGDTNPVQGGVLYDKFDEIEQVTARALNSLAEADEVTARALIDLNDKFDGLRLKKITQSAYDALTTKDENTLYIIVN